MPSPFKTTLPRTRRSRPAQAIIEHLEQRTLLTVQVNPIIVTAGQSLSNFQVATFTTSAPPDLTGNTPNNFSATIQWGGGLSPTSQGTISAVGNGQFAVSGSNTYTQPGSFPLTVTVDGTNNTTAQGSSTATVNDAQLSSSGLPINAVRQSEFSGNVAAFSSANPYALPSDFTASIDFGDGVHNNVPGTVTVDGFGGFDVVGQNTYAQPGSYPTTITIKSVATPGVTSVAFGTATVSAQPITGFGTALTGSVGRPLTNVTTATFQDPYPADPASDFQAIILWGDGGTSPATITAGAAGLFTVTGTHTYKAVGTYATTTQIIRLNHDGSPGMSVNVTGSALITGSPAVLTPESFTFTTPVNALYSGKVGSFGDTTSGASPANFSATITWGDGHVSTGIVTNGTAAGQFDVSGSNIYATTGNQLVSILIQDNQGNTVTISSLGVVTGVVYLTPIGTRINATAGLPLNGVVVGSFHDINPAATASNVTAMISWGTGDTSVGKVVGPDVNGLYTVTGSYQYANTGSTSTLPINITITDPSGQSATINSNVVVTSTSPSFTGALAPFSDTSPTHAGGFTNTNRPTFTGTAPAFSIVQLSARPISLDTVVNLGQAVTNGAGQWTLSTGPLANGIYDVTAVVTPAGGYATPATPLTADNGQVVIDTGAPRVVTVTAINGISQVLVALDSSLSGFNLATLYNPANYLLTGSRGLRLHPLTVTAASTGGSPAVLITTSDNPRVRRLLQSLTINGAAIQDMAGTSLQGSLHASLSATKALPARHQAIKVGSHTPRGPRR